MGIEELSPMPGRPDHPDFWKLSEIILQMDGAMQEAHTQEDKDVVWERFVGGVVDSSSIYYMGFQRAMRALGIMTAGEMATNAPAIIRMATLYTEAFLIGVQFKERT